MIGRIMRSRVGKALAVVGAVVVAYIIKEQQSTPALTPHIEDMPFRFSLEEPVPILGAEGGVHEISFLFPAKSQPRLIFHTAEPTIRCDSPDHKETGISSTQKCIKVFQETSYVRSNALEIKNDERYCKLNLNEPTPPASLRAILANTAGEEGLCVTDNKNVKTCLPSLHIMDFDYLPSATPANTDVPKWGGTIEEITEAMQMADKDITRAKEACQKAKAAGMKDYSGGECERRTTIAVRQFKHDVNKFLDSMPPLTFDNKATLFRSSTVIPESQAVNASAINASAAQRNISA